MSKPRQAMVVAAAVMVMPRSRPCGIQSLGLAVVDLAELVDAAGMKQEALADRGLAGVDVRDDADVADAGDLGWCSISERGGSITGSLPAIERLVRPAAPGAYAARNPPSNGVAKRCLSSAVRARPQGRQHARARSSGSGALTSSGCFVWDGPGGAQRRVTAGARVRMSSPLPCSSSSASRSRCAPP